MISLILWFEKLAVPNGHTYPSVTHSDHLRMQYKYFYSFNLCVIFSSICYVVMLLRHSIYVYWTLLGSYYLHLLEISNKVFLVA